MNLDGNILGGNRAEADPLLEKTFIKTPAYRALLGTQDFHFVVGRRGTGKSALFGQLLAGLAEERKRVVHSEVPLEHASLALQQELMRRGCSDYRSVRAVSRLLWRAHICRCVLHQLRTRFEFKLNGSGLLTDIGQVLGPAKGNSSPPNGCTYGLATIKAVAGESAAIAASVASFTNVDDLVELTRTSLAEAGVHAYVLFDSLDEGWIPEVVPTALLGGLAIAVADLTDMKTGVHAIAFIRDNMFRALAHFDPDFSRHVDGSDLRLRWDEESLLNLVAERVRVARDIQVENNIKVWNRLAHRDLQGREGFELCLRHTLYRPRDIISLLNRAYRNCVKENRHELIETDVAAAAKNISQERLDDLNKEYDVVFPGLGPLVELFRGGPPSQSYREVLDRLEWGFENSQLDGSGAADFALLGSAREAFLALHSVGFVGVQPDGEESFRFCHDGTATSPDNLPDAARIAVHPCYWEALDLQQPSESVRVLSRVDDDYETVANQEAVRDRRMQRLGQVVEALPQLREGAEDAGKFEEWVERAVKVLFGGQLTNVALHPNGDAVQRRDVVATNVATTGFWRRIYEDYQTRQVVFEVKNYVELKPDDFRQAFSYAGREHGRVTFVVSRTMSEGVSERDRTQILEYYTKNHLIVTLPAFILARCLSKQRSRSRPDYWDKTLTARLDTHLRSYCQVRSPTGNRGGRGRK